MTPKLQKILDNFVKKYSVHTESIDNATRLLEFFSFNDPSGNNKYVWLMMKLYHNSCDLAAYESPTYDYGSDFVNNIVDLIVDFHKNIDRISQKLFPVNHPLLPQEITSNPKDIQNYEKIEEIQIVISLARIYKTKKDTIHRIIEDETDIIYDGDDYKIVVPLTFESSCYWGEETKWCTTTRDNSQYYISHANEGTLFYIIDKSRSKEREHPFGKIAVYVKNDDKTTQHFSVYNRMDIVLFNGIRNYFPKRICDILLNYHINGGVVDKNILIKYFLEHINQVSSIVTIYSDPWKKDDEDTSGETIKFKSPRFPSINCVLEMESDEHSVWFIISWVSIIDGNPMCILKQQGEKLQLSEINRAIRQKDKDKIYILLNDHIWGKLNNDLYLVKIKPEIIKQIVIHNFLGKYNDFYFVYGDICNINYFEFKVASDELPLMGFTTRSQIDFLNGRFILYPGETDHFYWDRQEYRYGFPFDLTDSEDKIISLVKQFKDWVIETLKTKSEKFVIDIYDDFANKLISKSNAFEEYLTDNSCVPKVLPTSKDNFCLHGIPSNPLETYTDYTNMRYDKPNIDNVWRNAVTADNFWNPVEARRKVIDDDKILPF
jgi:hypothetical protein